MIATSGYNEIGPSSILDAFQEFESQRGGMMVAMLNRQTELFHDEDPRWEAVVNRDRKSDGKFVFAVSSTNIYCRPSCPSRRPRRDRVTFYESPAAAETAGFRACRRCHPQESDARVAMVKRVCELIDADSGENLNLDELSKMVCLSRFHLQRAFKAEMGISPREYAAARKAERFRQGVKSGERVTAAMYDAGYGSSSRLYESADAELGMTPATYGRGGANTTITYAIAECELGQLLIAATPKGVCAVRLGDDPQRLARELHEEFYAAVIHRNDREMIKWVTMIMNYVDLKQPALELPLDVRSTAFQRQVWRALRDIPSGETRSYSEVAQAIGHPTAARAVARACATNPVALVIPCHRVIREDKSLGGYRWGLDRKTKLLTDERVAAERGRD